MKRWIKAIAVAVCLLLVVSLCGFGQQCGEIRQSVVRLHVLANSDSKEDQALKLKVRDAIVHEAANVFDNAHTKQDALKIVRERLPRFEQVGQKVVIDAGYSYPVKASLVNMYFTTREYDAGTFPAGMYDALRVTIGDAKGKNWWCVVYPPLCVSAASEASKLSDVLDPDEVNIVTQPKKYEVRFKVVELFEGMCHQFSEWFGKSETK